MNAMAGKDECGTYELSQNGQTLTLKAYGIWTLKSAAELDGQITAAVTHIDYSHVDYDVSEVTGLDTAGAYLLARAIKLEGAPAHSWAVIAGDAGQKILMQSAAEATLGHEEDLPRPWFEVFVRIGIATSRFWHELIETLVFLGKFFVVLFRCIIQPRRMRWKAIVALIEKIGLDAVPIIMVLCFFIGAVIAYMGANLLSSFGASIFMVDLVGFAVIRELAPIITAILIAGRSDSAFTAQLGAMKMRQEIDAMTVIGLDTFEVLVVPRALAALVALPILTFLGMISGIFAGIVVAGLVGSGLSPILFLTRLQEVVDISNFWVGMVKTPFFAIIIAVIGCRQGLAVTGSVESLGARTTTSVVQAIFAVITVDAIFAILFFQMGI